MNSVIRNWHILITTSIRFSQLSSEMVTLMYQGNFPNLLDQDFITIGITREPNSKFLLFKTRTSNILGCSIFSQNINFHFYFGFIVGGFILALPSRSFQNLFLRVLSYLKNPLFPPKAFQLFPPYYSFSVNLHLFG